MGPKLIVLLKLIRQNSNSKVGRLGPCGPPGFATYDGNFTAKLVERDLLRQEKTPRENPDRTDNLQITETSKMFRFVHVYVQGKGMCIVQKCDNCKFQE